MNIALDLDGVIIDIFTPSNEIFKMKYGFEFLPFLKTMNFKIASGLKKEIAEDFVQNVMVKHGTNMAKPYLYSIESLHKISNITNNKPLIFVTARKNIFEETTRNWLSKYLQVPYILHMTGEEICKSDFLLKNNINIFVEDRLKTANELSNKNIFTYLVNQNWNKRRNVEKNVKRINNLKELLNHLRWNGEKFENL